MAFQPLSLTIVWHSYGSSVDLVENPWITQSSLDRSTLTLMKSKTEASQGKTRVLWSWDNNKKYPLPFILNCLKYIGLNDNTSKNHDDNTLYGILACFEHLKNSKIIVSSLYMYFVGAIYKQGSHSIHWLQWSYPWLQKWILKLV